MGLRFAVNSPAIARAMRDDHVVVESRFDPLSWGEEV